MIEGVVGIVRQRVSVAGFEMGESVKCAAQPSGHVQAFVIGEVKGCQRPGDDGDNVLDGSFKLRVTGAGIAIGRGIQARVGAHEFAPGSAHGTDSLVAGDTDRCGAKGIGQELTTTKPQAPKQIVEPFDVAVQGRLSNSKALSDPGEGHRVESFRVSKDRCFVDNTLRIERACHV